jgi:hypothetical protein
MHDPHVAAEPHMLGDCDAYGTQVAVEPLPLQQPCVHDVPLHTH